MLKLFEYFSFLLSGITKEAKDLVNSRSQREILQLGKNEKVSLRAQSKVPQCKDLMPFDATSEFSGRNEEIFLLPAFKYNNQTISNS